MSALFLLLIFFISSSLSQGPPSIDYITNTQIKDLKDTVQLTCAVKDLDDYSIVWMKVDKRNYGFAISAGERRIIPDPRFHITFDRNQSISRIQISDIQDDDAGYYQCQILLSPFEKVFAEVELQVRSPPSITRNSTRSILVSEGQQDVQMECYAEGFPPPTITWRRENNEALPTGGQLYKGNILKIERVRKEDRGTYFCVADNGVGKNKKRAIDLHVESAPVIVVPRQRLGQALTFDMDLACQVEAYPPPAIKWEKDNITLWTNQHYAISHFSLSDEYYDTTLRVIRVEKNQYGEYVCKAANKLGKAEAKIEFFETDHPICPPACATTTTTTAPTPTSTSSTSLSSVSNTTGTNGSVSEST